MSSRYAEDPVMPPLGDEVGPLEFPNPCDTLDRYAIQQAMGLPWLGQQAETVVIAKWRVHGTILPMEVLQVLHDIAGLNLTPAVVDDTLVAKLNRITTTQRAIWERLGTLAAGKMPAPPVSAFDPHPNMDNHTWLGLRDQQAADWWADAAVILGQLMGSGAIHASTALEALPPFALEALTVRAVRQS